MWDGFCWGIAPWDTKKVEAALKERGLNPVADNDGKDFQSFHVKDPDGFDLQISNGSSEEPPPGRRRTATLGVAPPFESTGLEDGVARSHLVPVSNYKESVAFYEALLGWKPTGDEGSQNECEIGDIGDIIIRGGNPAAGRGGGVGRGGAGDSAGGAAVRRQPAPARHAGSTTSRSASRRGIRTASKAELEKRGLNARVDTGGSGDIHDEAAQYKSYHTTTPNGCDLQISNATRTTRQVR